MGAMTGYSSHSPIPDISDVTSPVEDENVAAFKNPKKKSRSKQARDSQAIASTADGAAAPGKSKKGRKSTGPKAPAATATTAGTKAQGQSNRRGKSTAPKAPATTVGAEAQGPSRQTESGLKSDSETEAGDSSARKASTHHAKMPTVVGAEASEPSPSTSETEAGTSSHLTESVGAVPRMPTKRAVEFLVQQKPFSTGLQEANFIGMKEEDKTKIYESQVELSKEKSKEKSKDSWRICGEDAHEIIALKQKR
eukprot:GHVP01023538.1.p1 GENE.GHVP01023538.1~~GHVP01023538.1.p1  ORF type:complete len:252 (+),score=58.48 GHVP01023538.1:55-810(+)